MKKAMKKTCAFVLALAIVITFTPVVGGISHAEVLSGETGDCTWTYDSTTQTLTISGNGEMAQYDPWDDFLPPWHDEHWGEDASPSMPVKDIIIEDGVTNISDYAFYSCAFTSITIPDSVTSIGREAFEYDTKVTHIEIPNSVKTIGPQAFLYSGLTSVTIPDSVTSIGYDAFCSCVDLQSVKLGKGLNTLGSEAFYDCETLSSLEIPEGVKKIGSYAFLNTKLTSVTIPESVEDIGYHAFGYKEDGEASGGYSKVEGFTMRVVGNTEGEEYASANRFPYDVSYIAIGDLSKAYLLGITTKAYTGKEITQSITVYYRGKELVEGTDYSVSYSNNKNAGIATVTILGKGNYTGTTAETFKINKAANPLSVRGKTATVKFKKLKKKNQTLGVTSVIVFAKKGQGTLTYTKASGNKKITIAKNGKVTVKKKLKKGTYKVKVNVKAAGNGNYNAATKAVTFTIKVK